MNKKTISRSSKRLAASLAAAIIIVGAGNVTADIFAKAADDVNATAEQQYATGCLIESEESIKARLASDEETYNLDYISDSDDSTHDMLVNICKAAAVSTLPSKVDLTNEFPTPGDQKSEWSCACWAVGYALKSHQEYLEHGWAFTEKTEYSPSYLYNNPKIIKASNGGTYIFQNIDIISEEGICSLYNMKYDETGKVEINQSQRDIASNFKGTSDYLITKGGGKSYAKTVSGLNAVKEQLNQHNGVVIGIENTYKDFFEISSSNPIFDHYDSNALDYKD